MKLWSVKFEFNNYDQYDEFIIAANDEQECIDTLQKEYPEEYYTKETAYSFTHIGDADGYVPYEQEIYIQEINLTADIGPQIILGSYNAG